MLNYNGIFTDKFKKYDWEDNYRKFLEEKRELDKEIGIHRVRQISTGKEKNNNARVNDELLDTIQSAISILESRKEQGLITDEDIENWKKKLIMREKKYGVENE